MLEDGSGDDCWSPEFRAVATTDEDWCSDNAAILPLKKEGSSGSKFPLGHIALLLAVSAPIGLASNALGINNIVPYVLTMALVPLACWHLCLQGDQKRVMHDNVPLVGLPCLNADEIAVLSGGMDRLAWLSIIRLYALGVLERTSRKLKVRESVQLPASAIDAEMVNLLRDDVPIQKWEQRLAKHYRAIVDRQTRLALRNRNPLSLRNPAAFWLILTFPVLLLLFPPHIELLPRDPHDFDFFSLSVHFFLPLITLMLIFIMNFIVTRLTRIGERVLSEYRAIAESKTLSCDVIPRAGFSEMQLMYAALFGRQFFAEDPEFRELLLQLNEIIPEKATGPDSSDGGKDDVGIPVSGGH
jgi:uncharacterized protein (TIGR04222 family)